MKDFQQSDKGGIAKSQLMTVFPVVFSNGGFVSFLISDIEFVFI